MARYFQERRKGRELSRYPLIQFMLTLLPWWLHTWGTWKPMCLTLPFNYCNSFVKANPCHKGATYLYDIEDFPKSSRHFFCEESRSSNQISILEF